MKFGHSSGGNVIFAHVPSNQPQAGLILRYQNKYYRELQVSFKRDSELEIPITSMGTPEGESI
jgi:hypothetical protein